MDTAGRKSANDNCEPLFQTNDNVAPLSETEDKARQLYRMVVDTLSLTDPSRASAGLAARCFANADYGVCVLQAEDGYAVTVINWRGRPTAMWRPSDIIGRFLGQLFGPDCQVAPSHHSDPGNP